MEIGHDDETEDTGDDADEFDFVVAGDAGSEEIVGDLAVKKDYCGAGCENEDAEEEPTYTKIPVHIYIIHLIFRKR